MTFTTGDDNMSPIPVTSIAANDRRGDILAIGALLLAAYALTLIFVVVILQIKVDAVMLTLISVGVTSVFALPAAVFAFQFGSSRGSQDKNATIAANTGAATLPPTAPPTP